MGAGNEPGNVRFQGIKVTLYLYVWVKLPTLEQDRERRQSLYEQFRIWKRWKGKQFFIVVTQGKLKYEQSYS